LHAASPRSAHGSATGSSLTGHISTPDVDPPVVVVAPVVVAAPVVGSSVEPLLTNVSPELVPLVDPSGPTGPTGPHPSSHQEITTSATRHKTITQHIISRDRTNLVICVGDTPFMMNDVRPAPWPLDRYQPGLL
jgi:hypothetical protein